MSARAALQAAIVTHLAAQEGLAGVTLFDAPPVRGACPYLVVGEAVLADAGARGVDGREGRLSIEGFDGGERPLRLRVVAALVDDVMPDMAAAIGGGWRVATLTLVRSRIVRSGERWRSVSEFAVRMYRET